MKSDNNASGCGTTLLALFFIVFVGSCISKCGRGDSHVSESYISETGTDNITDAWIYIQQFVRRELKSPSTAKFEFGGKRGVKFLGNGRYTFSSYVDSQNSFGAMIRTRFYGTIKDMGSGWVMEELNFE